MGEPEMAIGEARIYDWRCPLCGKYIKSFYKEQLFEYVIVHLMRHKEARPFFERILELVEEMVEEAREGAEEE